MSQSQQASRTATSSCPPPAPFALRAHVLLRSRFAEDQLAAAVRRGVGQYVILGAGLDTFGYRQPDWATTLRIVEVDQPASQQDKRRRLADAGIVPPGNLIFAAVDFEAESLVDELARTGVDISVPTFFSWLGVSMYLTRDAVDTVFGAVASFPPSSELVFTFAQPRISGAPSIADRAAAAGEPWLTFFDPEDLARVLREAGFSAVQFLTREQAELRYFTGRSDALHTPRRVSIATATV